MPSQENACVRFPDMMDMSALQCFRRTMFQSSQVPKTEQPSCGMLTLTSARTLCLAIMDTSSPRCFQLKDLLCSLHLVIALPKFGTLSQGNACGRFVAMMDISSLQYFPLIVVQSSQLPRTTQPSF